jgi:hypothetical protein
MVVYRNAAKRLVRNLVRAGHLEELSAERLCTVPPTVVSRADGHHFLVGARSDAIMAELSGFPGVVALEPEPQRDAPALWRVQGTDEAVGSAAEAVGARVVRERGGDLLASLPPLGATLAGAREEGIPDRTERWNPAAPMGRSRWSRTKADGHLPGLYRTVRKPHQWYLRSADGAPTIRLDTVERRAAAAWQLVRGTARLSYDANSLVLSVPDIGWALPLLVDRGLILASGRLPVRRRRRWHYFDIDPDRARHTARVLGVGLEETT